MWGKATGAKETTPKEAGAKAKRKRSESSCKWRERAESVIYGYFNHRSERGSEVKGRAKSEDEQEEVKSDERTRGSEE